MADVPARFQVLLTEGAEQDVESIYDHISEFDCMANANFVLDKLLKVVESLSKFPERVTPESLWHWASRSIGRLPSNPTV